MESEIQDEDSIELVRLETNTTGDSSSGEKISLRRRLVKQDLILGIGACTLLLNLILVISVLTIYFSWNNEINTLYDDANEMIRDWGIEQDNVRAITEEIKSEWNTEQEKINTLIDTITRDWQSNYRNITRLSQRIENDWDFAYKQIENLLTIGLFGNNINNNL